MANVSRVIQYNPKKKLTKLRGLNTVVKNLGKRIDQAENLTLDGLVEGARYIYQQTESTPPITPVDTGALRASWFIYSNRGDETGPTRSRGPSRRSKSARKRKKAEILKSSRTEEIAEAKNILGKYNDLVVVAGYAAPYAAYVHEGIGGKGEITRWSRPGSGKWWFLKAFKMSRNHIMKILQVKARVR